MLTGQKGTVWNESETFRDPVTNRRIRRITTKGLYNTTPGFATNHGFSSDGEYLILSTTRNRKSYVLKCKVKTGELTVLAEFEGIGSRHGVHQSVECGEGVAGNLLALAPKTKWCIFPVGERIQAVHLETLEERILLDDVGPEWITGAPGISPDESKIVVNLFSAHPEDPEDVFQTKSYIEFSGKDFPVSKTLEISIQGGEAKEVYQEKGCLVCGGRYCPVDNNLVAIIRDLPPLLWFGSDGKTPRIWLLNTTTGEMKPLKKDYPAPFQVHWVWSFNGEKILYHGPLPKGGSYLGVSTRDGETIKEFILPKAEHYGHVSADPKRKALILDGDVTKDLLVWYFYESKSPRIEIIARHGTEWGTIPG